MARSRCKEIGSIAKAQEALHQGQPFLDRDVFGVVCESMRQRTRGCPKPSLMGQVMPGEAWTPGALWPDW